MLDTDDPNIRNYFNKTDVPNSFYLIMEQTEGYIEKCFPKELIKNIVNQYGYKIEPEKATKKDDFFLLTHIYYMEKNKFLRHN